MSSPAAPQQQPAELQQTPASPAAPAADPGQPLRFLASDALRLINVEAEAAACQTTFVIPPREERERLPVGGFALLIFRGPRGSGPTGERLWAQVTEAQEGRYEGLIDNDPVVFPDLLHCGMAVAFGPEHIAKIETKAQTCPSCNRSSAGLTEGNDPWGWRCGHCLESAPRERTPQEWLDEADGLYPAGRPCPCTTCRFARQAVQLQRQVAQLQHAAKAPEALGEAAVNRPPGYIVRGVDVPPGWMLVRLETAAGDYVIAARVPAFLTLPAVLVWGDRTFALSRRAGGGGYHAHYRECFTVVVLQVADVEEEEALPPAPGERPSTETTSKGMALRALRRFATAWAGGEYIPPSADIAPPPAPLEPATLRYCGLILNEFLGRLTTELVEVAEELLLAQEPAKPSLQSVMPEPPVGEHWWGTGGTCARCHARSSLAMNSPCAWRPAAAPIEVR